MLKDIWNSSFFSASYFKLFDGTLTLVDGRITSYEITYDTPWLIVYSDVIIWWIGDPFFTIFVCTYLFY